MVWSVNCSMPNYNISLNPALAREVERTIKKRKYANRSEFFRHLIRQYCLEEDYLIEELEPSDADYILAEARVKKSKGKVSLKRVLNDL